MKRFVFGLVTAGCLAASSLAMAERITITGDPVTVTRSGDYYVVPSTTTYTTTSDYYYFNVDGSKRVCYRDVQPSLAKVDLGLMSFRLGSDDVKLHCYNYTPDYFVSP